jgi:sugar phosphate isomerase/epimerase
MQGQLIASAEIFTQRREGETPLPRTRLGIAVDSYWVDREASSSGSMTKGDFRDPLRLLEHCREIGAGGIQVGVGVRPQEEKDLLRKNAEAYGMFVQGQARLPKGEADAGRFEAELQAARDAGATVVRVASGDRRYEAYRDLRAFQEFAARAWDSLRIAAPLAARCGVRLAVENHKDFRVSELLDMLRRLSSEHVGVCVDTNNSIALLEDPMEVVEALAPWAHAAHLKDVALAPYGDGFLLADVPLGDGVLDIPAMVRVLRRARPDLRFVIEMITRDPLKVPCLTDGYWATLPDLPARDLARTLGLVQASAGKKSLPRASHLSRSEQGALEDENIKRCLAYAREHLEL